MVSHENLGQQPALAHPNNTFEKLAEPFRRELKFHCYRMLGSVHDAEDLIQETFLRAWRGFDRFDGRSSFRSWLYTIATNACLNALASRKTMRRLLPDQREVATLGLPGSLSSLVPATDLSWLEPYPDKFLEDIADEAPNPEARYESRETIRLAFVAAIQLLPPRQRAMLLLCDVLGWSAAETATLFSSSTASVNSGLQRARNTLSKRYLPKDCTSVQSVNDEQERLSRRYIETWESRDMDGFIQLLKDDATLTMPPLSQWFQGRETIRGFHEMVWPNFYEFRLIPTRANNQPAFALYSRQTSDGIWNAHSMHIIETEGDKISALTIFLRAEGLRLFEVFGFPATC